MDQQFDSEDNEINQTKKNQKPVRQRIKGMPDITSLLQDESKGQVKATDKSGDSIQEGAIEGSGELEPPPDLQLFLPPDVWRKINTSRPRRGALIKAHERLRSTLFQLATFLPSHLTQEKMRRSVPGLVKGEMLNGTLLLSDVSGFTALSEQLAGFGHEGAERLTIIMNGYFKAMLDILGKSGGKLIKFAGDAMLVYFPELPEGEQANWAVRAGMRMLKAMSQFSEIETPSGKVALEMKVGLATGSFLAASVGSAKRMEYGIWGQTVTETMQAEAVATGPGKLVVNVGTLAFLEKSFSTSPISSSYYLVEGDVGELGDFEIKAGRRRTRGAIPVSADPQDIIDQMKTVLQQIKAVSPYLAKELVDCTIAYAGSREVESEFRPTTVIFCNFTGIEELIGEWGNSGIRRVTAILSAYFNEMHDIISKYGGVLTRIDPYRTGTKMLILFGAPVANEDDPQRAVSAALAMNIALRALNNRLVRKYSRHLSSRVKESGVVIAHRLGITSGETYAGQVGGSQRREYTVMGDDVNLAARLMGAASMGQILINRQVYDEVCDYFITSAMMPIRVKGKTQPMELFQVDGPAEDTLVSRARRRELLVSREKETRFGLEMLQSAMQGNGTTLAISGPVGIGKSHLADWLLLEAMEMGCRLLINQNRAYDQETPYASWRAILRSLFGMTVLDHPLIYSQKVIDFLENIKLEHRAELLASLMGVRLEKVGSNEKSVQMEAGQAGDTVSLLSRYKSGNAGRRSSNLNLWGQLGQQKTSQTGSMWTPLSGQLSEQERKEIYDALLDLIQKLAAKEPLVLFFEDAHWMDESSCDLLRYISENIEHQAVLLLIAHRSEDDRFSIMGHTLAVESLDITGTTALVGQILVSELAKVIHEQSAGNPLYIEEITRLLQRTKRIGIGDLQSLLKTSDIMQKLVLSSIEILLPGQRKVVKAAAIIGNDFRVGEVQALLQETYDPATISHYLRSLVDERFITLSEAGVDALYTFKQPLVRDILYDCQPFENRREMHARLADYLDGSASQRHTIHNKIANLSGMINTGNLVGISARIAHHNALAHQWMRAAEKYYEAGKIARDQEKFSGAAQYFQAGLEVLDKAETSEQRVSLPLRVHLLAGCGDMAMTTEDYRAALTAYQMAYDLEEQADVSGHRPGLTTCLALALVLNDGAGEAEEIMNVLSDTQEALTDPAFLAAKAWIMERNQKKGAADWVRRGQEALSQGHLAGWEIGINALLCELGMDFEIAVDAYQRAGMPRCAGLAAVQWGDKLLIAGKVDAAIKQYAAASSILEEKASSDLCGLALVRYRQAEAIWHKGNVGETLDKLQEVSSLYPGCDTELHGELNEMVRSVLEQVNQGLHRTWPSLAWQRYVDLLKVSVIFHLP